MTHEPECDDFQNDNPDGLCICQRLRDAYERGHEDAVESVKSLAAKHGDSDWALTVYASAVAHGIEMALSAGRGAQPHQTDPSPHTPRPAHNVVTAAADDKSVKAT